MIRSPRRSERPRLVSWFGTTVIQFWRCLRPIFSRRRWATSQPAGYAKRLLSASDEQAQPIAVPAGFTVAGLAEPLTPREAEILRLIAAGMRNQEIADRLVISLSTVKRHIANTYGKLGVDHRTEAVARLTT